MTDLRVISDNDLLEEVKRRKLKLTVQSNRPKTSPPERNISQRKLSPIKPKSSPTTPNLKEKKAKTFEKKSSLPRSNDNQLSKTYYIPSFLSPNNRHPSFSKAKRFYDDPYQEVFNFNYL